MFTVASTMKKIVLALLISGGAYQAAWPQFLVNFADPDLEALIRAAIGIPSAQIFSQDLRGGVLTSLDASDSDITSLGGLEYATELEELDLSGNDFSNISALSTLVVLRELDLSGNRVNNVTPLQPLRNLEDLDLSDNALTSLEALLPNTGLGVGDTIDARGNPLGARTRCGVLATFAARGATVFADGDCNGTAQNPGNVDQQPDLFGTLLANDPNSDDDIPVDCGSVEVYQNSQFVATAVTDVRGYFYVEGLEAGQFYDLVFHAQGFEDVMLDNVVLQAGGHEIVPPRFDTPSEPVISGTILLTVFDDDAPRPPIAGALVRAFQFDVEVARTVTCSTGYFEFDDDAIPFSFSARLEFSAGDFVPEPLEVFLPALDLVIGLEKLTFPNSIVGVVVDGLTGDPIEGAQVLVQPTLGFVTYARTTDADGAYVVENVDDGEYSAHAAVDGFKPVTRFGFVEQDLLQIDLELPREGQGTAGCSGFRGTGGMTTDIVVIAVVLVGLLAWRRRSSIAKE